MKTLNVKLPIYLAEAMSDSGELNSRDITYIIGHMKEEEKEEALLEELPSITFSYSFKVPRSIHKTIKLLSIEYDIPMNELTGRLLTYYYRR